MTNSALSGAITFENFAVMRQRGIDAVNASAGEACLDIGGIDHANTLAVGAMVAWVRHGEHQNTKVKFVNVPDALRKIIRVSGLTDILLEEA
jgi:anti-anti-sigma regulatory factor